jgi:hypothetical protein
MSEACTALLGRLRGHQGANLRQHDRPQLTTSGPDSGTADGTDDVPRSAGGGSEPYPSPSFPLSGSGERGGGPLPSPAESTAVIRHDINIIDGVRHVSSIGRR